MAGRANQVLPNAEVVASATAPEAGARTSAVPRLGGWLDRWGGWIAFALSGVVVAFVYGQALSFAFTFDDPLDLPRAEGRSIWSLFSTSEGYAYYRPIPFVIWKFWHAVQGRYSQATLHGLTLVAHAVSGWLLYLLLRRLTNGHWGLVAMVLFLTYPFSYQVVFGAHTLFHPLMTAAILASLLLYLDARRSGSWSRLLWSLLFALVALWTHESGVVLLPLVVGAELFHLRHLRPWRPSWWPVLYAIATAAFLAVWYSVPKWPSRDGWSPSSLLPNGRYFLQGVVYPVTSHLNGWAQHWGFDPVGALWPTIGATVVALLALYAAGRRVYIPLMALTAILVTLTPAWLVLRWSYVVDAPRLLYPASGAIAALWGLLPALQFRRPLLTVAWRATSLLLLGAVLAQSLAFISIRRDMWAEGTTMIDGVVDTAAAHPTEKLLFLNVPAWFAPKQQEYPTGHSGLTAIPGYVGLGQAIYVHRGVTVAVESRGFYPDLNGWKYDFNTHGPPATLDEFDALLRRVNEVYRVDMLPTGATIVDLGGLRAGNAPFATGFARFGAGFILLDARASLNGNTLSATLDWGVSAPPSGDYWPVLSVHDSQGVEVARTAGYPIGGVSAPRLWRVGDRVSDHVQLALPGNVRPGVYRISVGWEEKSTRQPLPGVSGDGTALPASGLALGQFTAP